MSRRKYRKPVRQTAVFTTIPKLIEGEDYSVIVLLLLVITIGLLMFTFPQYIFAGLSFDFFLMVIWQIYSGIALKMEGRKVVAKYTQEREPASFYRNLVIWFLIALIALLGFLASYFTLS